MLPVKSVVRPTASGASMLRPIDARGVRLGDGSWGERVRLNRERTIAHGWEQLRRAGNLTNLRLAAGAEGRYQALGLMFDKPFPFLDSDVYKWLEAVGWELARAADPDLARQADEAIALVAAAQRPDGYLNSFVQVLAPGREYRDLDWGHELYCYGHLIQAAVAWHRALGDGRLLDVAVKAVASLERELGPTGREALDGHPLIEMALVELYRETGERRYVELASRMIDLRGRGLLGPGRFGAAYWQDHAPVREAPSVAGHAVRQLYLDCGAVDVATELGDGALLDAVKRRWDDMVATRMYLTGGLGSRHKDESFGDPFELPPDRAYAETCAAIASVMLAWRLLLATGEAGYADAIERTMYNGVLPALSLDGTRFFYVNALQRRTWRAPAEPGVGERRDWYACACCPPNLMRLLSSWEHYLATSDADGIQLHQYATGDIRADVAGGRVAMRIETGLPWEGRVAVTILETPEQPWTLSLRLPSWSTSATLDGRRVSDERTIRETRTWRRGDALDLTMEMTPRVTAAHPRVDAVRGCVALERGPLVYCLESADLPAGVELEDIELPPDVSVSPLPRPDIEAQVVGLTVTARHRDDDGRTFDAAAIPYFTWGNRSPGAMRVWIPRRVAG